MITRVLHFMSSLHSGDCNAHVAALRNENAQLKSECERLKVTSTNQQLRILSLEKQLARQVEEFKISTDNLLTQLNNASKRKQKSLPAEVSA